MCCDWDDLLQDPDVAKLPFDLAAWCSQPPDPSLPFVFNRRQQQQQQELLPVTNAMPRPIIRAVPEVTAGSSSAPAPDIPLGLKLEARSDARCAPWFFTELPPGRFEVAERAGSGAFGLVYKALDTVDNKWVALKRIQRGSRPLRLQLEIRLLGSLVGAPNICQLLAGYREMDQVTLVMEYTAHDDFHSYCTDLSPPLIAAYMYQLMVALEVLHDRDIIHRDIKPANCLFSRSTRKFSLIDFGLAEVAVPEEVSQKGPPNRAGTRGFRAPEVLLSCSHQTSAIDIWSAGIILLCLLSGRFSFFVGTGEVIVGLREIADLRGSERLISAARKLGRILEIEHKPERPLRPLCEGLRQHPLGADLSLAQGLFELLERLLALHPAERITATEALALPVLQAGKAGVQLQQP
jgi:cell division control protein 7